MLQFFKISLWLCVMKIKTTKKKILKSGLRQFECTTRFIRRGLAKRLARGRPRRHSKQSVISTRESIEVVQQWHQRPSATTLSPRTSRTQSRRRTDGSRMTWQTAQPTPPLAVATQRATMKSPHVAPPAPSIPVLLSFGCPGNWCAWDRSRWSSQTGQSQTTCLLARRPWCLRKILQNQNHWTPQRQSFSLHLPTLVAPPRAILQRTRLPCSFWLGGGGRVTKWPGRND